MQDGFEFGFYNSKSDSIREYDAKQFGKLFDGVITDGVFPTIGNQFKVVSSNSGMKIKVNTGKAWLNHTWNECTQIMEFKLDDSSIDYARMDAVILRIESNELVRENKLYVKTGTVSQSPIPPELEINEATQVWEYPIAIIKIPKDSKIISNSNIINLVGLDTVPEVSMSSYNGYLLPYVNVISNNSIGSGTIIISKDDTQWKAWHGMFKRTISNVSNIQNKMSIAKNAIFNVDLFIPTTGSITVKNIQDQEQAFSYIFKYEVNDNNNTLTMYAYYKPNVAIQIRFIGKGIQSLI